MLCCGSKPVVNGEKILQDIRSFDNTDVEVNLNNCKLKFLGKEAKWKTNFSELPSDDVDKLKEKINTLTYQLESKTKDIDELERQYLAKIAELLVLSQTHCEIKTEINAEFDKLGVSTKEYERQRVEEVDDGINQNEQSFRQSTQKEPLLA